jgi:uncharacterized protein YjbI with pentapeptide repeats
MQRNRIIWRVGFVIVGTLFLIVIWILLSAASAHETTQLERVTSTEQVTVQATPTEDATVTALNKEKLAQEVQQLKNQNEPASLLGWLQTNASILLSTLVVVIGALVGFLRWLGDRRSEQEKRAEERFQSVVEGLGSERETARVGAAIMLRTFLRKDYEQFYSQTFDLAVAHLRLPRAPAQQPKNSNMLHPLTSLNQALIAVLKESFPLARDWQKRDPQFLDATGIQLDNAYLVGADLESIWMQEASLEKATLNGAILNRAHLEGAHFEEAYLEMAHFEEAYLEMAHFERADLKKADFSKAHLNKANLDEAYLYGANFHGADLSNVNLENARSLEKIDLRGIKGLTEEQLKACKKKGAITDEGTASGVSQSQSNDAPSFNNEEFPPYA